MKLKLFIILLVFTSVFSQNKWNSHKEKISIPFELTHNLMIVDVNINKANLKMILDTGSEKNLLFSFPERDTIKFYNPKIIKVKGLGYGESLEAYLSSNNHFSLGNGKLSNENFEILLITNQDIGLINKLGVPINGILGSSFFKDYIVEINYAKQKIFLHRNKERIQRKIEKRYNKLDITLVSNKPYLTFDITNNQLNNEVNLLFDTGLSDGLWLFENEKIKCSDEYFIDVLGKGLGGDITGKKSRINELLINQFALKEALVSFPDSISIKNLGITSKRNGSLGGEIIKRFNWFLDYSNDVFYLRKNNLFQNSFNYNMSGIQIQHTGVDVVKEFFSVKKELNANNKIILDANAVKYSFKYLFKPSFVIFKVRKNSPADKAGIKEGDKLVSLNNKKAYHYTIQTITDLFQSEEGKKIKIEVQREGKLLRFEFELEKIL